MTCIDKILDFYNNHPVFNNPEGKEWFGRAMVNLMNKFNKKDDKKSLEIKNCLILLMNLFSDNESPDLYSARGKDFTELSENEQDELIDLLNNELGVVRK